MDREFPDRIHAFEPQYVGTTPEDHLIFLRDTHSDRIPNFIVRSRYKDNRFKARAAWWAGLLADLEEILDREEQKTPYEHEINLFIRDYYGPGFHNRQRTTEDIIRANRLINNIVSNVESDPMLWTQTPLYNPTFVY